MPIYEYLCEKCGHEFEREQRITEDPIKACPACKSRRAKRLISQTSFVLKGGGWYSDLYSSADKKKKKKGGSSGDSAPSSKSDSGESSSDSKKKSDKSGTKSGGKSGGGSGSKASKHAA